MKTTEEYLALPYTFTVRWENGDSLFVARVKEIPRCSGHGNTEAEAINMVRDNLHDWIEDALEDGDPIPTPEPSSELPSGKWVQRVSRSVHAKAAQLAQEEGVSLNHLVADLIAEAVGARLRKTSSKTIEMPTFDITASAADPFYLVYRSQAVTEWSSNNKKSRAKQIPNAFSEMLIASMGNRDSNVEVAETEVRTHGKKESQYAYNA